MHFPIALRSFTSYSSRLLLVTACFAAHGHLCHADPSSPEKLGTRESESSVASVAALPLEETNALGTSLRAHFGRSPHLSSEVDPNAAASENLSRELLARTSTLNAATTKGDARNLSLQDAILLSLAQNPSFAITRLGPTLAEQDVLSARGIYDTIVRANADAYRDVAPSDSSLSGSKITTEQVNGNVGIDQKLPTGADLSLAWVNSRVENDALFTSLSPAYRSALSLSLRQPLLRGTGWGAPGVLIRIARSSSQVSKDLYESQVADQVQQVVQAYWSEVRARELVEVRKRGVELSERLQSDINEGVKVGQLAPLSLSEANAQIALSREQLIVAENLLLAAGRNLRRITGIDFIIGDNGLSDYTPLRASDRPEIIKITFDANQSVELALAHRAELRAQKERLRFAELSAKLASNQVLPELNLEGRAGLQGLAGTDRGTDSGFGGGASPYPGDYGDALSDVGSKDFYDYAVGLRFQMPLENRAARAEFNRRKVALLSEQHRLRALTQSVIEETLAAVSSLDASSKRVKAAQEAVTFSRQNLEVQRDKLNAGLSTVRDVLETQRDFSEAELRMAEALTHFSTSLADVLRARGELLGQYRLTVEVL